MFTKSELELIYAALNEYWLNLNDQHQKNLEKGRHNNWQFSTMQKVSDLQSKVFNLELSM